MYRNPQHRLQRMAAALFASLLSCGGGGASSSPERHPFEHFVGANGGSFTDGFAFVGENLDPWRFITSAGEVYSLDDIRGWVTTAVSATGARVIRMTMNGGAFEPSVGTYGEAAFEQLDRLVAACVENRVHLIIALRDYLWSPWPTTAYDPYWYLGGGTQGSPNKQAIMTDPTAKTAYKAFMSVVVNRKNTVTGTVYKDDTNILGWELINEPPFYVGQTKPWIEEMSGYLKGIDPNHLVGVAVGGVEATWWDPTSSNWGELATSKLDFVDLHYYADPSLYYPSVDKDNVTALRGRIVKAKALGKPVILGEFGLTFDHPQVQVEALYETVMDAAIAEDTPGIMPYAWGPAGPNGWGGSGGYDLHTNRPEVCALVKARAP